MRSNFVSVRSVLFSSVLSFFILQTYGSEILAKPRDNDPQTAEELAFSILQQSPTQRHVEIISGSINDQGTLDLTKFMFRMVSYLRRHRDVLNDLQSAAESNPRKTKKIIVTTLSFLELFTELWKSDVKYFETFDQSRRHTRKTLALVIVHLVLKTPQKSPQHIRAKTLLQNNLMWMAFDPSIFLNSEFRYVITTLRYGFVLLQKINNFTCEHLLGSTSQLKQNPL